MNQSQLFKHPGDSARPQGARSAIPSQADAAYEVICEALMKGSAALDALITTDGGYTRLKSASARLPVIAKPFATSSAERTATLSAIATSCVTRTSGIRI